ncbi:MAG: hypothetical protein COV69_01405 [Parcubacteria group bacterium CG11_big_fil_rev_8_21_14_0_20_39_14]|nr:MAG: hypothetical protein COV69_01405 [Parcubacteria group bacterium CG11_big_fil_rev_8_21_14_0_20_39_14]PIS35106.1 MAG: hypothetical protein COT36_04105 [Parcubacteria group bacterium CG08_land_8_20_14_0_20_38_56]
MDTSKFLKNLKRFLSLFVEKLGLFVFLKINRAFKKLKIITKDSFPERWEAWPKFWQWKRFPEVLNLKEKVYFCSLFTLFFISLGLILQGYWIEHSKVVPQEGGEYCEALIGQPRFVNPLLAPFNDVDRDISQLIFSGLMKYNEKGKIVPDLAENYEIKEDGKIYEFSLKRGVRWHDGAELRAEDVIFTIKILQDPEYTSPLRINWQGVKVEKIDAFKVRFILENSYAPFLENLTLGILPKHLWENIHPKNFPLADLNIKGSVGTGPYKFKSFKKNELGFINLYTLEANPYFYNEKPYIKEIKFFFFFDAEEAILTFNKNLVRGLSSLSPITLEKFEKKPNSYLFLLPRYFSIFLNKTHSDILSEKNVRQALILGTDKKEIIGKVWSGQAKIISSPILPEIFGFNLPSKKYDFNKELAKEILEKSGFKDTDGDGLREKIIEKTKKIGQKTIKEEEKIPLEITLTMPNTPEVELVGTMLKEQWKELGLKLNLEILESYEIQQDKIKPREYDAVLFGEILGMIPDPFPFWHSSQKKDPGLNLSLFGNRNADKLLEEARQSLDNTVMTQKYEEFQELVLEDCSAIFLYSPPFIYLIDESIKGIEGKIIADPSKRFIDVEKWYIKTKRVWKQKSPGTLARTWNDLSGLGISP